MSEPRLCVLGEHLASWPCHCDEIKNYLATHPSLVDLESEEAALQLAIVTHADCIEDWRKRPPGSAITQHGLDSHIDTAQRRVTAWRNLRREGK